MIHGSDYKFIILNMYSEKKIQKNSKEFKQKISKFKQKTSKFKNLCMNRTSEF